VGEIGKSWVGKERHVAKELMADVGLRCVEGLRVVADVLGCVKYAEGKT
jgi:hypothetical protein